MYRALLAKDPSFEEIFFVGVKSTGIFCRPTCRARKPKRENVEFFSTVKAALQHGYRPCKVCVPLKPAGEAPDWLTPLMNEIDTGREMRIRDYELQKRGLEPNRIRRWFKKNHGITFQSYLRSMRLGRAFGHLTSGGKVIDAAFSHGYDSLSGFTGSFKKLLGSAPSRTGGSNIIHIYQIATPLGPMLAASAREGICLLEFTDRRMLERELKDIQHRIKAPFVTALDPHIAKLRIQLDEYFSANRIKFDVPLFTPGSQFQIKVWEGLKAIPYGQTRSYKQQALALGNKKAVRAVANANGQNRIAIVIPCHRVIGADGSLTGYGGGLERKKFLLDLERKKQQHHTAKE